MRPMKDELYDLVFSAIDHGGDIFDASNELVKDILEVFKNNIIHSEEPKIDCPYCNNSIEIEPFLESKNYLDDSIEIDCSECDGLIEIKCTEETIEREWEIEQ